jgi:hypothetical protein
VSAESLSRDALNPFLDSVRQKPTCRSLGSFVRFGSNPEMLIASTLSPLRTRLCCKTRRRLATWSVGEFLPFRHPDLALRSLLDERIGIDG